ncbi:MAG: thioesterase family protein [Bacteroidota bacterium]
MITHETQLRVRYAETDQMKYVYYGNYATYYEVARVECLRMLGVSYKSLEEEGIMLPVVESHIKYVKPAVYDDLLTIKVTIEKMPTAKITFDYKIYNEAGVFLNVGQTILVFIDMLTNRPMRCPEELKNIFIKYF